MHSFLPIPLLTRRALGAWALALLATLTWVNAAEAAFHYDIKVKNSTNETIAVYLSGNYVGRVAAGKELSLKFDAGNGLSMRVEGLRTGKSTIRGIGGSGNRRRTWKVIINDRGHMWIT